MAEPQQKRPLHALSQNSRSTRLAEYGLSNHGCVGYIWIRKSNEKVPLEAYDLTFPRGIDFFYTADKSLERFEGRNAKPQGKVGYVRTSAFDGCIQLFRFYDQKNQSHLFVTNPDLELLSSRGFIDESTRHPMYLQDSPIEGTVPLFFYSNLEPDFFSSLDEDSESESIIEEPLDKNAAITERVTAKESINAEIVRGIFLKSSIEISHQIRPALSVETLAEEIADVVRLQKPGAGNMTGIFGPWGRGKTRLMNEIWSHLELRRLDYSLDLERIMEWLFEPFQRTKFIRIDFQAWRYQDTPASWAYLYEQFSSAYLGNPRKLWNLPRFLWRLFRLSLVREGWFGLAITVILLGSLGYIIGAFLSQWINQNSSKFFSDSLIEIFTKKNIEYVGAVVVAVAGLIGLATRLFRFTKAANLVKRYAQKSAFKQSLGIQAEIQKELICLIRTWATANRWRKKKLVLFVDDLDRCDENKLMEIIDALRLILDAESIEDKLLVITALDERLLENAIKSKYGDLIGDGNSKKSHYLREYIDKLFVFSVKLGPLSAIEAQQIFDAIIEDDLEAKAKLPAISTDVGSEKTERKKKIPSTTGSVRTKVRGIIALTVREVELFRIALKDLKESTPRKIKIVYYRYRFAKNLLISDQNREENPYWLRDPHHETFIKLLIAFSQEWPLNITSTLEHNSKPINKQPHVTLDFVIERPSVDQQEYIKLLKILELVIAY